MEDSPCLYISVYEGGEECAEEDDEEWEMEGSDQEESGRMQLASPAVCKNQDVGSDWELFPCQHCERHFSSRQGLSCHIQSHALPSNDVQAYEYKDSNDINHQEAEKHQENADSRGVQSPRVLKQSGHGHPTILQGVNLELEGSHACKYCDKIFSTHTNKRQHERRVHKRRLAVKRVGKTLLRPASDDAATSATSQNRPLPEDGEAPVDVQEYSGSQIEHYMLDITSNISENLSLYIDGKIVSTSMASTREVVEVNAGPSALVGLETLILDPAQVSQVLSADVATGNDKPCPLPAKRRTATPPLLPQIKTDLESEGLAASSSSSLVSSLIENLLPLNVESPMAHKGRSIFLSPKLKRLLDKRDGLKPPFSFVTDGQKLCSPLSVSLLPAGNVRYKRRTASPPKSPPHNSTPNAEEKIPDAGDSDSVNAAHVEAQHVLPTHLFKEKDDTTSPVEETERNCGLDESWPPLNGGNSCNQQPLDETWPPLSGGNSCNQQPLDETWPPLSGGNSCNQLPLDLSNALKRSEDGALTEAALDLSLQKQSLDDPQVMSSSVLQPLLKKKKPNTCMLEKAMMNQYSKGDAKEHVGLGNPEAPADTDFAIVAGSAMVAEPATEGLVYGLTLPPDSLNPSHNSLLPVALQPSSPCTIALAPTATHTALPAGPSLITVLASAATNVSPTNEALQVLPTNMAPEPLIVCTERALNPTDCDLNSVFAEADAASLVTLSQPFGPALNLPGHVFLTDRIALNVPVVESTVATEVPFSPAVTLNDSLVNSYNITSNTVLIECTISLESPENIVPEATRLQENTVEAPAPTQMVINHSEQQQVVSLPSTHTVDPAALMSSIAESGTVSNTPAVTPDCPTVCDSNPVPESVVDEQLIPKVEEISDQSASSPEPKESKTLPPSAPAKVEEPVDEPTGGTQQQTFTKNFACNVCDKLFHSMKELGHHVGDHADEWPYKCEFCVLLFGKPSALLEHRLSLHGVGKTYVCSACSKEFVYLCNLKHHQEELHPGRQCSYTEDEKGKLRPQNYNSSSKAHTDTPMASASEESKQSNVKKEEVEAVAGAEELLTTINIMSSEGSKLEGPDVRLGINQHYPSFKPPPFPYHNRSPAGLVASATNFTTHNIPQTFSTAIRCTKCGKSFDNMPELHKHILACANASDKRRYTPKKNPIPLRHFAKDQNGVLSTANATNGLNASHRPQANRSKQNREQPVKNKLKALDKRKKSFVQRAMSQRNKSPSASNKTPSTLADGEQEAFDCLHCGREFTMRRSRTKHMAVCPKKPKEIKKRKDAGVSVTKENNRHPTRGAAPLEEKRQASAPAQKSRVYGSGTLKRSAILPVQAVLSSKRSKIIIKESIGRNPEESTLNEPPVVRPFNPSMRQYSRVQQSVKGGIKTPLRITIVRPQPEAEEPSAVQSQAGEIRAVPDILDQTAMNSVKVDPGAMQHHHK